MQRKEHYIENINANNTSVIFRHGDFRSFIREYLQKGYVYMLLTEPPYTSDKIHRIKRDNMIIHPIAY